MTADDLRELAYRVAYPSRKVHHRDRLQAATIIRTVADLQEPARKALERWDQASGAGECVDAAGDLAAIVERMLEAAEALSNAAGEEVLSELEATENG